jgi:hypothetical protein
MREFDSSHYANQEPKMHLSAQLASLLLSFAITTAWAQVSYDDENTPEGRAWSQIKDPHLETADFTKCGGEFDPHNEKGWDDQCRQISAKFLVDILTDAKLRNQIPRNQVRLQGIRINGDIDLTNAEITAELWIDSSRIDGKLLLDGSHWTRLLSVQNSILNQGVSAARMRSESDLRLRRDPQVTGEVDLFDAKIGGDLILDSSSFASVVYGGNLHVTGNLLIRDQAVFAEELFLVGATISGDLNLRNAEGWRIDLSAASARELLLRGLGWQCHGKRAPMREDLVEPTPAHWKLGASDWHNVRCGASYLEPPPTLILRNAHFDTFQDSAAAWPPLLDLEGFRYERLGGRGGEGRDDMRRRSIEEWKDWFARDPTFSTLGRTPLGFSIGPEVRISFAPAESLRTIGSLAAHGTSWGYAFSLGEHKVTPHGTA